MNTDNNGIRVPKTSDFLNKIKNSDAIGKLKEIKNLPLIIAIIVLAVCLLVFTGGSKSDGGKTTTENDLETRLSETLSQIDGAGEVRCLIYRGEEQAKETFFGAQNEDGEIVGVIIVADGAKDISVMLKLKEAAVTALCVTPDKVQVYKKQQK